MKKTVLFTLVGLLMLAFAATMVSAGPNPGRMHPFGGQQANLTDAQKEEMAPLVAKMKDLHQQMFEVKKEMIQKQVSFGNLTQEQADQHIAKMQEMQQRMEKGPRPDGMGMGMGRGHGRGMMHGNPDCQLPAPEEKQ